MTFDEWWAAHTVDGWWMHSAEEAPCRVDALKIWAAAQAQLKEAKA